MGLYIFIIQLYQNHDGAILDSTYSKGTIQTSALRHRAVIRFPSAASEVSYSHHVLQNLMDMRSLFGTMLRTILNYKRDTYVHI